MAGGSIPRTQTAERHSAKAAAPRKSPSTRKRAAVACEECRARKRKCDGKVPSCDGCRKRMCECVYASDVQAWAWHQRMTRTLRQRLAEMEKAEELHVQANGSDNAHYSALMASVEIQSDHSSAKGDMLGDGRVPEPQESTSKPDDLLEPTLQPTLNPLPSRPLDPAILREREAMDDAVIAAPTLGQSTPQGVVSAILGAGMALSSASNDTGTTTSLHHARAAVGWQRCACSKALNSFYCDLPPRKQCDALLAVYFGRHNRMFPILHQETFMQQYRRLWSSRCGDTAAAEYLTCVGFCAQPCRLPLFVATLNAVFATGSLFGEGSFKQTAAQAMSAEESNKQSLAKAEAFFCKVWQADLLSILSDDHGLGAVQLGLLICIFLQSTEKYSRCRNILGLTICMARHRGLHLGPEEAHGRRYLSGKGSQLQREMRARLWTTCVILDTEISLVFAQPCITDSVDEALLPAPIDDELLYKEHKHAVPPNSQPCLMSYFIHTAKLYNLIKEVHLAYNARAQSLNEVVRIVLKLYHHIMEWRKNLPLPLRYEPAHAEEPTLSMLKSIEPGSLDPVGLPALARRLYCRYIHSVQLTLRPAFESFFEMQHNPHQPADTTLDRAVLEHLALQCVLSANQLNSFISSEIDKQRFPCWWYNVAYLHTCGSTFSIARLCNFSCPDASPSTIAKSLDLCLDHLSRYVSISAVARNCHQLLRESDKRFANDKAHHQYPSPQSLPPTSDEAALGDNGMSECSTTDTSPYQVPKVAGYTAQFNAGREDFQFEPTNTQPFNPDDFEMDPNLACFASATGGYGDLFLDSTTWPSLPWLSQLEPGFLEYTNI